MKLFAPPCPIPQITVTVTEVDGHRIETLTDNTRAIIEWEMLARGVSPAVVERVMRLNPGKIEPGRLLRGIRYSTWERQDMFLMRRCVQKGEVIRKFGRTTWNAIPRAEVRKVGRRCYVPMEVATMASFEASRG